MSEQINFFAETTFRNQKKRFGIKPDDRRRHFYILGKTGMGKTVLEENMVIQDIQNGNGVGVVDPHGDFAEKMLDFIPPERIRDVIYFNPGDLDFPIAFNIMEKVDPDHKHLLAAGLLEVFKKIWPDVWSARMEYILSNCILALLEYPGSTILGINRMLADIEYRKKVVDNIKDPVVKAFWTQEYASYTQRLESEAKSAIQNKIGQFISAAIIRNIVGQVKSKIDMRKIMDEKKILIMNMSKGRIGEENARLLGALLITKLQLAAMSRVDIPEEDRKDFYLYIDEFQNFATKSFTNILSEARKYRLALILANQYITQMEEEVRDAIFGNVGTMVIFRVGAEDAEFLEREFLPAINATDLVSLGKYNIYLKLMIDGLAGMPFSAETLPPWPRLYESSRDKIIELSREKYGTPRNIIEEKIFRWAESATSTESVPQSNQSTLFDAKCSICGKDTKIVFQPDGKRPVYCKNCLKKIQQERAKSVPGSPNRENNNSAKPQQTTQSQRNFASLPTISLDEAIKKEAVSFSPGRKEEDKRIIKKRKEVNLEELKEAIKTSLESAETADIKPSENQSLEKKAESVKIEQKQGVMEKGEIKPGETIEFK